MTAAGAAGAVTTAAAIGVRTPGAEPEVAPVGPTGTGRRRGGNDVARRVVLGVAALYFLGPLAAAVAFTLRGPHGPTLSAYTKIFSTTATGQVGFTTAVGYSLEIAVVTIVLALGLMLPTQLLLHLRLPQLRGLVEVVTLLPLVFPPIVLVVGVNDVYTQVHTGGLRSVLLFIRDGNHPLLLALLYVMLAMPFVYRTLDAGIRSVDVARLVEAARNLGASWPRVLLWVLLPSLRTAVVNAGFLCFALVMGEFTVAQILTYTKPFPVWLYQLPTTSGQVQAAVSLFSLVLVEALLLLIGALNSAGRGKRRLT